MWKIVSSMPCELSARIGTAFVVAGTGVF
jgi:hypothetical protein